MKRVTVAFDIDGTLRCNCTDTCRDPNEDIVQLARILKKFKNVSLIAWSGGGEAYCRSVIRDLDLSNVFSDARCFSKLDYLNHFEKPDIAIDDIQAFSLGAINLIVREK